MYFKPLCCLSGKPSLPSCGSVFIFFIMFFPPSAANAQLQLTISSGQKRIMPGEPYGLTMTVTNTSENETVVFENYLETGSGVPGYGLLGFVQVDLVTPAGQRIRVDPIVDIEIEEIRKARIKPRESLSYQDIIFVEPTRARHYFREPGTYRIRMTCPQSNGADLQSNELSVEVVAPDSPEVYSALRGERQSLFLFGMSPMGPDDPTPALFERLLAEHPESRYAPYIAYRLGWWKMLERKPYKKESDYAGAIALLEPLVFTKPPENFPFRDLSRLDLARCYHKMGRRAEALGLLDLAEAATRRNDIQKIIVRLREEFIK